MTTPDRPPEDAEKHLRQLAERAASIMMQTDTDQVIKDLGCELQFALNALPLPAPDRLPLDPARDMTAWTDPKVVLWGAINEYAASCGGDTGNATISDRRMDAVAAVGRAIEAVQAADLAADRDLAAEANRKANAAQTLNSNQRVMLLKADQRIADLDAVCRGT